MNLKLQNILHGNIMEMKKSQSIHHKKFQLLLIQMGM